MTKDFVVTLKESRNPLQDLVLPMNQRVGFIGGVKPIIPIYFHRYMGIKGVEQQEQDDYYNELFELEQAIQSRTKSYIRFDSSLPMPSNEEIGLFSHLFGRNENPHNLLRASTLFSKSKLHTQFLQAFDKIITLYIENERPNNSSKLENFSLKMMAWLNRYRQQLFTGENDAEVPKVLFYGEIKLHEVYFLIFLALIGTDILYVHTEKDKDHLFEQVERKHRFSYRNELPYSNPLSPFPVEEKRVRKKTVAFEASQEIDSFLYGEDVGIFKARQYDSGTTKPITLKTTHDELKILWNEEAKVRPEFRVKDKVVYVPNLFTKINGTSHNLKEYWNEIHELTDADNTLFLREVGFTPIRYSRQELYSTVFLLNQEGLFDKEALFQHPVYKLSYLKESTQHFIHSKINELIQSDMMLKPMDIDLKVKTLMTILSMDAPFMRLIEAFDYTGKVPKIVVFDQKRETFTEGDIILLLFFNLVGADILIYTPTNYNNIEQWVRQGYFDTIQLPSVQFDLIIPDKREVIKKGFFQRLFSK